MGTSSITITRDGGHPNFEAPLPAPFPFPNHNHNSFSFGMQQQFPVSWPTMTTWPQSPIFNPPFTPLVPFPDSTNSVPFPYPNQPFGNGFGTPIKPTYPNSNVPYYPQNGPFNPFVVPQGGSGLQPTNSGVNPTTYSERPLNPVTPPTSGSSIPPYQPNGGTSSNNQPNQNGSPDSNSITTPRSPIDDTNNPFDGDNGDNTFSNGNDSFGNGNDAFGNGNGVKTTTESISTIGNGQFGGKFESL